MKGAAIARLELALQRALKTTKNELQARRGFLDRMLAAFFIDVYVHRIDNYPANATSLDKLFASFSQKNGNDSYLQTWDNPNHNPFYLLYKHLLLASLDKLKNGYSLKLLSTPTNEPTWIAPEELAKRLNAYEADGVWPDDMDLQVAVSRCRLKNTQQAISLCQTGIKGDTVACCCSCLGKVRDRYKI